MEEKTKSGRKGVILLVVLLLLVALGIVAVKYFGEEFARTAFNRLLERELPENYSVQYQDLQLDLLEFKLKIQHLELDRDTLPETQRSRKHFQVFVPTLDIKLKSIWSVFSKRELIIEGLSIFNPEISVADFAHGKQATITSESVGLFELITNYLNLFAIDFLDIEQAHFSYQKDSLFELADIDFQLRQFELDSTMTRTNFFNAEFVELIVSNEHFLLNDNIHELSFDQMRLSTQDSILSFQNIQLQPLDHIDIEQIDWANRQAVYDITIPAFNLRGIDYAETYLSNAFCIDRVELLRPNIQIQSKSKTPPRNAKNNDILINILQNFAPLVSIEQISVSDGTFSWKDPVQKHLSLDAKLDYLDLFVFQLDPHDFYFSVEAPPIQQFRASIKDYQQRLSGGFDAISAKTIRLNSMDSTLLLEQLDLQPSKRIPDSRIASVSLAVPKVQISEINYLGALFGVGLQANNIQIDAPRLVLNRPRKTASKPLSKDPFNGVKALLKQSNLPYIRSNRIQIENGNLAMDTLLNVESFNLTLNRLALNPAVQNWSDLLEEFECKTAQLDLHLPQGKVRTASFQTDGEDHQLEEVTLEFDLPALMLRSEIPQLQLYNTVMDSLVLGNFNFDSLLITQAQSYMELKERSPKEAQKRPADPLRLVKFVSLQDNQLELQLASGEQLKIDQLNFDIHSDSTLDVNRLLMERVVIEQAAEPQVIAFGELKKLEAEESYQIKDVRFEFDSTTSPVRELSLPGIAINAWDRTRFFDKDELHFESIKLQKPRVVYQQVDLPKQKKDTSRAIKLPLLWLDTLQLQEASLDFMRISKKDSTHLSLPTFDLDVWDISGRDLAELIQDNSIYEQNMLFRMLDTIQLETPNLATSIAQFSFGTKPNRVNLQGIALQTKSTNTAVQLQLDSILLAYLNPGALIEDQRLKLGDLALHGLSTTVALPNRDSTRKQDSKQEAIQLGIPMEIEQLTLFPAQVRIQAGEEIVLENLKISMLGLQTDTLLSFSAIDENVGRLELDLGRLSHPVGKQKEYTFSQSLRYNSESQELLGTNVRLSPNFTPSEFNQLIDHQTDYFDVSVDSFPCTRICSEQAL